MTPEALNETVAKVAKHVVADPRWRNEADDLGVSILGMILYGYALATGRMIMMLEVEDIDRSVLLAITGSVGSAEKWASGLVAEANRSSLDPSYHPGQCELVGVGHSYIGNEDLDAITDNIFANIRQVRSNA